MLADNFLTLGTLFNKHVHKTETETENRLFVKTETETENRLLSKTETDNKH